MTKRKTCFVISPIGPTDSPQRKRADVVLKHIFKPALEALDYDVVRADEISTPGSITLQVLEKVLESDLVVADLTDHNPNVFYELAVRHASQLPVIHVIASDQKIPFDVADLRTIPIDIDLDGAEKSRQAITSQVEAIQAGHSGQTPIKVAGALKHLSSGQSDEQLIMKQILEGMAEMRTEIRRVVTRSSHARPTLSDPGMIVAMLYNEMQGRLISFLEDRGDTLKKFDILPTINDAFLYHVLTSDGRTAEFHSKTVDADRILMALFHQLEALDET